MLFVLKRLFTLQHAYRRCCSAELCKCTSTYVPCSFGSTELSRSNSAYDNYVMQDAEFPDGLSPSVSSAVSSTCMLDADPLSDKANDSQHNVQVCSNLFPAAVMELCSRGFRPAVVLLTVLHG